MTKCLTKLELFFRRSEFQQAPKSNIDPSKIKNDILKDELHSALGSSQANIDHSEAH